MALWILLLVALAVALPVPEVLPYTGDSFLVLEKFRIRLKILLPCLRILLLLLNLLLLPTDYSL